MIIRNVWSVLCRDILTDQETNSVSYIRCIEEGAAVRLPVQIGPVFLGTLWEKRSNVAASVGFRVILVSPGQQSTVLLQTRPVILDRARQRLHFRINALNLDEFGAYMLMVEFNSNRKWETAARLPVFIHQIKDNPVRDNPVRENLGETTPHAMQETGKNEGSLPAF